MCNSEQIDPMIASELSNKIRKTSQSRKALSLALTYLDHPGLELRNEVLAEVDRLHSRSRGTAVEDVTIRCALAKILGVPFTCQKVEVVQSPTVRKRFGILASAWMEWAAGLSPWALLQKAPAHAVEFGGALQWMSLDPWQAAIEALAVNDTDEARRLFRRSVQLGTQCQTDSNTVVQWAYTASFFR